MSKEVLLRLKREVLDAEPGAALPSRLSDEWLQRAIESIEGILDGADTDPLGSLGFALVLKTLSDKNPGKTNLEVPVEKTWEYLQLYMLEISLEELSRKTEFRASAATLETIFESDRAVEVAPRG